MMIRSLFVCFSLILSVGACTKKNPEAASPAAATEKTQKPDCEDGKVAKILEGDNCPGTWAVQSDPKSGKKVCVFNYGPPISCPEGTKSTTYQAVCYGSVTRETASAPADAGECESQFGKVPNPAPYRLACCPQ